MNRTDYEEYYQVCSPLLCRYSFNKQTDTIYLFTNIISLVGGLTVALKIFIPSIVRFRRHFRHLKRTIIE